MARPLRSAPPIVHGRFTSYQVNVDANGDDIVGDAANEPSIAVNPLNPNNMVIVWRQFDTIASDFRQAGHAYSFDGGQTWTFPGVLTPGVFRSDPVVDVNHNGRFLFYSLTRSGSELHSDLFRSDDGGVTWSPPVFAAGGDKHWMVVDRTDGIGRGNIYLTWTGFAGCCGLADFARSINGGLSVQTPLTMPDPGMVWGTIAVGLNGEVYLAGQWANPALEGHVLIRSSNAKYRLEAPAFDRVSAFEIGDPPLGGALTVNPAGILGQTWIAVDRSNTPRRGYLYVLQSLLGDLGDPCDVRFVRSPDGGLTFSSPVRVNDDPIGNNVFQWFGTMSVAPNGRIDVVWNDTRNDPIPLGPETSELYYTFSLNGGETWYPPETLTPAWNHLVGFPQQDKIGDYYQMISENSGARLAYAATFRGGQDVYYLRITPDCNANGVADEDDIAGGSSADCNANLIPDECDPPDDCNGNGIQDVCDVASGTSEDCNLNGIPDSCEPAADCNANGRLDSCDVVEGDSEDCNANGVPDECELIPDCNANGVPDACDLPGNDCNGNQIPDTCDLSGGVLTDVNQDGVPDQCVGACCECTSCTLRTSAACAANHGAYVGNGTACAPGVCPDNDHCGNKSILPGATDFLLDFDSTCASADASITVWATCDGVQTRVSNDIWYGYTAPCCGQLTLDLCETLATNLDAVVAVYDGGDDCACPLGANQDIACANDVCGQNGVQPVLTLSVEGGRCYTIRIAEKYDFYGDEEGGVGSMGVHLTCELPACGAVESPTAETPLVAKNRYLSFTPGSGGQRTALRVTLDNLPLTFWTYNGQARWVGAPEVTAETGGSSPTIRAAKLVCDPVYRDWGAEGTIHVYDPAIVPSGRYSVQAIHEGCSVADGCDYSAPLALITGGWGDVVTPFSGAPGAGLQPNFQDVAGIVDSFRGRPGAPSKTRSDLQPNEPDRIINFLDVSMAVAAFQGYGYPFTGPTVCP